MFLKLIKHELHAVYRSLLPLFGGLLAMSLLARGSIWLLTETKGSTPFSILGIMFIGIFILACGASIVLTAVLMMVRFARTVHGDEGYLTNTLPVGCNSIILSRLLVSLLALLTAYLAVYLGYRLCTFRVDSFDEFRDFIQVLLRQADVRERSAIIRTAITILISLLTFILQIFAAISIGHSFSKSKTGMSVLFYFVLYFATQIINTFIMIFSIFFLSTSSFDGLRAMQHFMDSAVVLQLIYCGVFYYLTWIMMKKRLNLA